MLTATLTAALMMTTISPSNLGTQERTEQLKVHARAPSGVYRKTLVIKNDVELSAATPANGNGKMFRQFVASLLKVDTIDWKKQMIIVIYGGERPTGGYSVELNSLVVKAGKLTVNWKLNAPAADTIVTQAVTHPELVLLVDRFDGAVVFSAQAKK